MSERMAMLERLVASDTALPEQLMPGTGLCNLEDTGTLSRYASDLGCAAAMVLRPFFYPPSDEGLCRYFAQLIETLLAKAMALGAGGCSSASCNLNITAIRAIYEAVRDGGQTGADMLQP